MASSLDILQNRGPGVDTRALELARLREQRLHEMQRNLAMAQSDPRHFATGATPFDMRDLESDIEQDPWTGQSAQQHVANVLKQNAESANYNRPDVTARRNQDRAYELQKAGEPERVRGAGALAVEQARIGGEKATREEQGATTHKLLEFFRGGEPSGGTGSGRMGAIKPTVNTKGELSFTTMGAPRFPASLADKIAGTEASLDALSTLRKQFDPAIVGPAAGRYGGLSQIIPGLPLPKGYADFAANSAILQNAVIKAITGAQMSEPEAARISKQIPLPTDKPEVWHAKANATEQNLRVMSRRAAELATGGPYEGPMPGEDEDLYANPNWGGAR